jgi:hypothetical protein
MDRIGRLSIVSYAPPAHDNLRTILTVAYKRGSTDLDRVELLHDGSQFWARSTYLGMLARLEGTKLESMEKDLEGFWPSK